MTFNSIRNLVPLTLPCAPGPTDTTDHSVGYASTLHPPATTLLMYSKERIDGDTDRQKGLNSE